MNAPGRRPALRQIRLRLRGDVTFPTPHHLPQRPLPDVDEQMDVIRHHAPRQQFVTLLVKEQQRVLAEFRDARIAQQTLDRATVQVFLQLRPPLTHIFNLQQMLPLAPSRGGHGIGETKRDELDETGEIAVRQIPALMPAEEAEGAFLIREWARPLVLVGHQLAQVFAFGSWRRSAALDVLVKRGAAKVRKK